MIRFVFFATLVLFVSACQSVPAPTPTTPVVSDNALPKFAITGKIGITTISPDGRQAISAFYAWGQQDGRFSIDLTGALGLGATSIRYDGKTATLNSEQTGTLTADTPENLLIKATGWHAPISQLPYWIIGKTAPSDTAPQYNDNGQLTHSQNSNWQATFDYHQNNPLPHRLRISHQDGHRVVLTINHQASTP